MSVAAALDFIRSVRRDPALQAEVEALPDSDFVAALCAAMPDLAFSAEELDRAFEIEWYARWLHFGFRGTEIR